MNIHIVGHDMFHFSIQIQNINYMYMYMYRVSLRLNFTCIFCPFASYGVWVGISSLYELVCYAHVFPCIINFGLSCLNDTYTVYIHAVLACTIIMYPIYLMEANVWKTLKVLACAL